jgi:hypothetical protein
MNCNLRKKHGYFKGKTAGVSLPTPELFVTPSSPGSQGSAVRIIYLRSGLRVIIGFRRKTEKSAGMGPFPGFFDFI